MEYVILNSWQSVNVSLTCAIEWNFLENYKMLVFPGQEGHGVEKRRLYGPCRNRVYIHPGSTPTKGLLSSIFDCTFWFETSTPGVVSVVYLQTPHGLRVLGRDPVLPHVTAEHRLWRPSGVVNVVGDFWQDIRHMVGRHRNALHTSLPSGFAVPSGPATLIQTTVHYTLHYALSNWFQATAI